MTVNKNYCLPLEVVLYFPSSAGHDPGFADWAIAIGKQFTSARPNKNDVPANIALMMMFRMGPVVLF